MAQYNKLKECNAFLESEWQQFSSSFVCSALPHRAVTLIIENSRIEVSSLANYDVIQALLGVPHNISLAEFYFAKEPAFQSLC